MKINVLIVDDSLEFASDFEKSILFFKSSIINVEYHPVVKSGSFAFQNAFEYISEHQNDIDIVFIDYNLNSNFLGIDLLKLISPDRLIYKVLHSVTRDTFLKNQSTHKEDYDHFIYSKRIKDVIEQLKFYEDHILSIRLFGNPLFKDYYYTGSHRNFNAKLKAFDEIAYCDILFATTNLNGDDKTILYYRENCANGFNTASKTKTFPLKNLTESSMLFKKVNPSVVVNLLWVASIDTQQKIISFITQSNLLLRSEYSPTVKGFDTEITPFICSIEKLPDFFKK